MALILFVLFLVAHLLAYPLRRSTSPEARLVAKILDWFTIAVAALFLAWIAINLLASWRP